MIKQLFRLGSGLCKLKGVYNNKILANQYRYYFSQGTQSIDDLRNKLTELNTQFYQIEEYQKKEEIMYQVIDVKTKLNLSLYPNKPITDGQKYQGYRRDLLMLAQLHFENDKREECNRLLQQIMQGDFQNEFGDHKDENQAFLSGLYIIHCLANLEKLALAEQSAVEALQYLDYFVENKCPIYQSSIKEEKPTSDGLLEDELQQIQNLVSHLLLLSKISSERGKVSESVEFLGLAATHLDNMGHLFRKVFSKQIEIKTELKDEELKKFFMQILINEAITLKNLAKSCIQLKRYEDADNLIQAALTYFDYLIEQKLLPNYDENYITTLISKYQLLNLSKKNDEEMKNLKDKLDSIASQLKENDDTLFTLVRYELFLNEYFNTDTAKVDQLMAKIDYNVPVQLEFNQLRLQNLLAKNQSQAAIELGKKQLNLLKENFDESHNLYEETLQILLELAIMEKNLTLAKEALVQLSSGQHLFSHIVDFDQMLKLQRLRIEFYDRIGTDQPIQKLNETIEKIDSLAFATKYHAFKKATTVAQCYETIGNKEQSKSKYQESLKVLEMDSTIPNCEQLMKNIQDKLSKFK